MPPAIRLLPGTPNGGSSWSAVVCPGGFVRTSRRVVNLGFNRRSGLSINATIATHDGSRCDLALMRADTQPSTSWSTQPTALRPSGTAWGKPSGPFMKL